MGWFDGFPFRSAEQRKQEQEALARRVFPLGLDAHRAAVQASLAQIMTSRSGPEERMFAYIVAKDKYLLKGKGEEGLHAAWTCLKGLRYLNGRDVEALLALLRLDAELESLDAYPSPETILAQLP